MENIAKHLDTAFAFLDRIPVMGEAVDLMAMARQELRHAYAEIKQMKNESEVTNDG